MYASGERRPLPTLIEPGLSLPGVGQAWTLYAPLGATGSNQDLQPSEALEEWVFQNLGKLLGEWKFLMVSQGEEQRRGAS